MNTTPTREASRHPYPPRLRTLSVISSEPLSPTMRRFVFAGGELEPEFPFVPLATGMHVKVVVPQEDTGRLEMPTLGEHGLIAPEGARLAIRDYSVRGFDAETRLLTIDFVLHDHGPAGRWAIGARNGSRLGILGPRGYTIYPNGFERYVLGADETALPALERWIEETPAGARIDAFVAGPAESRRPLPSHPKLSLRWIAGTGSTPLVDALTAAAPAGDGRTYLWAAGEAGIVAPLRRHLQGAGFARTEFDVSGYWRLGRAGSGEHAEERA
jgi:NADPH-dependent ferric siderophore reductase